MLCFTLLDTHCTARVFTFPSRSPRDARFSTLIPSQPPSNDSCLKPPGSPFTGEYHELEQRWFPWQRTALSSKCAQYSGNVPDEATRRWVTFVCFICFRGPEEEQCAQRLLHKGVIHATAGSFIFCWFIYCFVCSHTWICVNRDTTMQACVGHVWYDGADGADTFNADLINCSLALRVVADCHRMQDLLKLWHLYINRERADVHLKGVPCREIHPSGLYHEAVSDWCHRFQLWCFKTWKIITLQVKTVAVYSKNTK